MNQNMNSLRDLKFPIRKNVFMISDLEKQVGDSLSTLEIKDMH